MPTRCYICLNCDNDIEYEYHCYDCFVTVCLDCSDEFDCYNEEEWIDISGDVIMADSCCV